MPAVSTSAAELASQKVDSAVVLDGNLDAQVTRQRCDRAQHTQELLHVLLERDRTEPFGLPAQHAADNG